ncbi:MAG TPA: AAA family ATPase [Bryobacteraceae bacterium]|nr:AAA family ATPase [Bryobacteraceae bacterium]
MSRRHPVTVGLAIAEGDLRDEVRAALQLPDVRIVLEQNTPIDSVALKRLSLDLVLIDAIPAGTSLESELKRIKTASPETLVAVVHRFPDAELMLEAMRAGTDDFVTTPIEKGVRSALDRVAAQCAQRGESSRAPGKVVGVVAAKGGCGATTVACHLASEFQRVTQHDILLADLDLESGLVAFLMQAKTPYGLMDALRNVYRLDSSLWQKMVWNARPRLDVMPCQPGLLPSESEIPQFREVFRLIRSMYGWVIADLGRPLSPITLALLEDLDELLLVATPSIMALYQAKQFLKETMALGYPRQRMHLILNRVPKRSEISTSDVESSLGLPVYAELSEHVAVEAAYTEGKLLSPESELGKQFTDLALRTAGVRVEKAKGWGSLFGAKVPAPGFLRS